MREVTIVITCIINDKKEEEKGDKNRKKALTRGDPGHQTYGN